MDLSELCNGLKVISEDWERRVQLLARIPQLAQETIENGQKPREVSSCNIECFMICSIQLIMLLLPSLSRPQPPKEEMSNSEFQNLSPLISPFSIQQEVFRLLREPLAVQLSDRRSAVARQACDTITNLAAHYGSAMDTLAQALVPCLCKLVVVTIQVGQAEWMHRYILVGVSKICLCIGIQYIHQSLVFNVFRSLLFHPDHRRVGKQLHPQHPSKMPQQ